MARKVALTRTISLQKDTLDSIISYSDKYFQGNMSAAIGYMCIKFMEYENSINSVMFSLNHVNISSSSVSEEEKESKEEKDKFAMDLALGNINILLGGDKP